MMDGKNDIAVVINGRIYNLSGYEDTEYLQEVANYMNSKIAECKASDGFRRMSPEYQNILLAINIADDYFKAKNQTGQLAAADDEKEKQIYEKKRHDSYRNILIFRRVQRPTKTKRILRILYLLRCDS